MYGFNQVAPPCIPNFFAEVNTCLTVNRPGLRSRTRALKYVHNGTCQRRANETSRKLCGRAKGERLVQDALPVFVPVMLL